MESLRTRRPSGKWLVLAAIALMMLLPTKFVTAGGLLYIVNTTSDTVVIGACQNGGAGCSLRGAIQTANAHPGADGIDIDLPAGSIINLTAVLPDLTESISITGPGANLVTVRRDAGGTYRIFSVTTTGAVGITGLTISNGQGGIINVNAAPITVTNCILSGNVAPGGLGGGIYNNSTGALTVTGCTFNNNSAGSGGGIFNNSTGALTVTGSTFSGNTATGGANNGGGIRNNGGGTMTVLNSTFTGNSASNEGGGISKIGGPASNVTNCVFENNVAGNGGGISNTGGTLNVTNCTFTGNGVGANGGGIANNFFGTVNVSNSTFSGNIANNGDPDAGGGGAIGNGNINQSNGGFLNITNCTITGNIAFRGGGIASVAAFAGGSLTVTNSTIVGNQSGSSSFGGGISTDSSHAANIKNTIVALSLGTIGRDVNGIFVSSGFNLIGKVDGSTGFTAATDQTGTIASPLDPKIDPAGLQNNGGPTRTIALQFGSPAIDKASSNGLTGNLTTDQRGPGFPRIFDNPATPNATGGDGTDIGAFEVQTVGSTPTPTPTPTATPQITVVPPAVQFTGVAGGAFPAPQSIQITPSNGASWTSFDTSPWFDAAPTSGGSGTSTTLTPHTEGLGPGTYTENITFSATGCPSKVVVVTLILSSSTTPTPTPTATPVNISGHIFYCSNPVPGPVPNVTLTLTGSGSGSTLTDSSGNYQLSALTSGGSYTVTPTKAARAPGSAGINTFDVVATQRHFLNLGTPLSGCRLMAADVNSDTAVNTVDVISVQRFFLTFSTGLANVGKYKFSPANRSYTPLVGNQTGQNYDTLVFGDVVAAFVE